MKAMKDGLYGLRTDNIYIAIIIAALVCCVVGVVNVLLVSCTSIDPFIVTMGTQAAVRGIVYIVGNNTAVTGLPQSFKDLSNQEFFGISAAGGPTVLAHTKYVQMENLNDVTFHFPRMKKVVEHIGYPHSEHLFTLMANDENLWTDLAMLYHRPVWMTWNMVLAKEMGVIDRVMFASDFVAANNDLYSDNPTKDLLEWIDLVQHGMNKICRDSGWPTFTEKEINGILHDNAARLYNLT